MDITEILIAFPAEEKNRDDTNRDFWVLEKNHTSTHFFSYLESSQEIEISSKLYSLGDPGLMSKLEKKFSQFEIDEAKNTELSNKSKNLKLNQSIIRQIDFSECQDLDGMQRQKFKNGQSPDKLEHFTDWLHDYIEQTKLWQVRYPKKILKISVVDVEIDKGDDELTGVFSKYAIFENLDSLEEKYFIKIEFLYDLEIDHNTPTNPDFEFYETKIFFVEGNTCVDPTTLDDFDFWYRVLILGEDPYQDDGDDFDYEEVDISI